MIISFSLKLMVISFLDESVGKEFACNERDPGLIPGSGRSTGGLNRLATPVFLGFPCGSAGKESACNAGDLGSVNYKLALTKSIANDWTTKAFAICPYRDWTPCCYSCWPSTTPEGIQGGVRHSVLQGICWGKSLDSWIFLGTDFITSILASQSSISSYLEMP